MAEKTALTAGTNLQNGKYILEKKIGSGGFGITYKGVWKIEVHTPLGATTVDYQIAVKEFFFEEYCSRDTETGHVIVNTEKGRELFDKFKEKLKKEAAILLKLEHPNIVNVSEVFEENNTAYMVMEYVDGKNLKDLIGKGNRYNLEDALKIIKQVGSALHYIHSHNIIHLDIKPANILIDENGNAKLIDFGIAKQYSDANPETQAVTVATFSKGYSPIEQYAVNRKEKYGPHTDVYALGATCYHCLTGEVPIESAARLEEELIPPSRLNPQIPIHVEWAIQKAMELKYKNRFASIADFIEALDVGQAVSQETNEGMKVRKTILKNNLKELDTQYLHAPKVTSAPVAEKKTIVSKVNLKKYKKEKSEILDVNCQENNSEEQSEEKQKISPVFVWSMSIVVVALLAIWLTLRFILFHSPVTSDNATQTITESEPQVSSQENILQQEPAVKPTSLLPSVTAITEQKAPEKTEPKPAITATPNQNQPAATSNPVSIESISIRGHSYTGGVKNGKPDGKGKISYTCHDRISPDDSKETMAEAGDYLEGYWREGLLEQGILYDKSGIKKGTVIIGRY